MAQESMIQEIVKDLIVTRSREHEAPACLALLPGINGAPAELLIARGNGKFAGAAAVLWANWSEPAGFNILVRVLKRARGQGVGRALVKAAADLAHRETDGLWSQATPVDSPKARFLEACGFVSRKREYYFQVGVASLLANIGPIAERFRARGRIPDTAEVIYLSEAEAPLDEIAWLVAREFNSSPVINIQNLRRRLEDNADRSLLARLDGELVGALLWHVQDGVAVVDVNIVSERWRSGWANLVMLEKGLLRAQAEGVQHTRFYCDETNTDTKNLARRGQGEETDVKARYYLAFD
jgi:GNAT superfamily N-acetyltransferase